MAWNAQQTKLTEEQLQRQCVTWFRAQYKAMDKRLYAIPNGGKRDVVTAVKMKQTGATAGVWDIFLSIPKNGYGGLYIEMKVGRNGLSDLQKQFQEANKDDYAFAVCRTLDEFMSAVKQYLFGVNEVKASF